MKKKTKFELRRELRRQKEVFLTAIHLQCCDCMGMMTDGYQDCGITRCVLYPFRIKKGQLKAKKFKAVFKLLKQLYKENRYPEPSFWKKQYEKINLA